MEPYDSLERKPLHIYCTDTDNVQMRILYSEIDVECDLEGLPRDGMYLLDHCSQTKVKISVAFLLCL